MRLQLTVVIKCIMWPWHLLAEAYMVGAALHCC